MTAQPTMELPLPALPQDRPVLISGPTAAGKSALALQIARAQRRMIVNADALQAFDGWHILTARPRAAELAAVPHRLYGHVDYRGTYSVGAWLRDLAPLLRTEPPPVIVGGTGLYFRALTEGLADMPVVAPAIRRRAEAIRAADGLDALIADLDPATRDRIDLQNPARVLRAWEVAEQTGRGLAAWQDETPPALLPLDRTVPLLVNADPGWLADRIEGRFDAMLDEGLLDEVRRMLPDWDPNRQSSQAIGAAALIQAVRGTLPFAEAVRGAKAETRQYAKRQRSWARARMRDWTPLSAQSLTNC